MLLLLVAAAAAEPVDCTAGVPAYVWPEPDAVEIPTNAAPFAILDPCTSAGDDVTATLTDADDLPVASTTVTPAGDEGELLTVGPRTLEAGAAYTFTIDSAATEVLAAFTTGDTDAVSLAEAPELTLSDVIVDGEGGGEASVTVEAPDGALAIAIYGNTGMKEHLESTAEATAGPHALDVLVAPGEPFCAAARALGATGLWADAAPVCTEAQAAPLCGVPGATGVTGLGLGLAAALVGRRRR